MGRTLLHAAGVEAVSSGRAHLLGAGSQIHDALIIPRVCEGGLVRELQHPGGAVCIHRDVYLLRQLGSERGLLGL